RERESGGEREAARPRKRAVREDEVAAEPVEPASAILVARFGLPLLSAAELGVRLAACFVWCHAHADIPLRLHVDVEAHFLVQPVVHAVARHAVIPPTSRARD